MRSDDIAVRGPSDEVQRRRELTRQLSDALRLALPAEAELDRARARAHRFYRELAELVVELRHQFPGPDSEPYDLRGRSAGYRAAVRDAYRHAGVENGEAVPKRLTAGVAYWVRKLLIERYGKQALYEAGVLRGPVEAARLRALPLADLPEDPTMCLTAVVEVLNNLAVNPHLIPSEDVVRAAIRAVVLLKEKVREGAAAYPPSREPAPPHGHGPRVRHGSDRRAPVAVAYQGRTDG